MSQSLKAAYPPGLRVTENPNARLRARSAQSPLLIAPGCFDCLTARLVETAGFEVVYPGSALRQAWVTADFGAMVHSATTLSGGVA